MYTRYHSILKSRENATPEQSQQEYPNNENPMGGQSSSQLSTTAFRPTWEPSSGNPAKPTQLSGIQTVPGRWRRQYSNRPKLQDETQSDESLEDKYGRSTETSSSSTMRFKPAEIKPHENRRKPDNLYLREEQNLPRQDFRDELKTHAPSHQTRPYQSSYRHSPQSEHQKINPPRTGRHEEHPLSNMSQFGPSTESRSAPIPIIEDHYSRGAISAHGGSRKGPTQKEEELKGVVPTPTRDRWASRRWHNHGTGGWSGQSPDPSTQPIRTSTPASLSPSASLEDLSHSLRPASREEMADGSMDSSFESVSLSRDSISLGLSREVSMDDSFTKDRNSGRMFSPSGNILRQTPVTPSKDKVSTAGLDRSLEYENTSSRPYISYSERRALENGRSSLGENGPKGSHRSLDSKDQPSTQNSKSYPQDSHTSSPNVQLSDGKRNVENVSFSTARAERMRRYQEGGASRYQTPSSDTTKNSLNEPSTSQTLHQPIRNQVDPIGSNISMHATRKQDVGPSQRHAPVSSERSATYDSRRGQASTHPTTTSMSRSERIQMYQGNKGKCPTAIPQPDQHFAISSKDKAPEENVEKHQQRSRPSSLARPLSRWTPTGIEPTETPQSLQENQNDRSGHKRSVTALSMDNSSKESGPRRRASTVDPKTPEMPKSLKEDASLPEDFRPQSLGERRSSLQYRPSRPKDLAARYGFGSRFGIQPKSVGDIKKVFEDKSPSTTSTPTGSRRASGQFQFGPTVGSRGKPDPYEKSVSHTLKTFETESPKHLNDRSKVGSKYGQRSLSESSAKSSQGEKSPTSESPRRLTTPYQYGTSYGHSATSQKSPGLSEKSPPSYGTSKSHSDRFQFGTSYGNRNISSESQKSSSNKTEKTSPPGGVGSRRLSDRFHYGPGYTQQTPTDRPERSPGPEKPSSTAPGSSRRSGEYFQFRTSRSQSVSSEEGVVSKSPVPSPRTPSRESLPKCEGSRYLDRSMSSSSIGSDVFEQKPETTRWTSTRANGCNQESNESKDRDSGRNFSKYRQNEETRNWTRDSQLNSRNLEKDSNHSTLKETSLRSTPRVVNSFASSRDTFSRKDKQDYLNRILDKSPTSRSAGKDDKWALLEKGLDPGERCMTSFTFKDV